MKAQRRHQLASNALARELEGIPGQLKRHASTILTVILGVLAVVMLVRWRLASAEQAHQAVIENLSIARASVEQLRSPMLANYGPKYLAERRRQSAQTANEAVSAVLNTSDDPKLKAQALIARGDLYWQLANFPELPGASTQPSLQSMESPDTLLKKSADAYTEVLKTDSYVKQQDAATSAHFGLAAIAENRGQWDEARKQLETIANNADVPQGLVVQAKQQLELLNKIQTPMYLATAPQASTAEVVAPNEATMPTSRPITLVPGTTRPAATQASQTSQGSH